MNKTVDERSTRTLVVMRHAKSSWDDVSQADHDRPLNERGRRDATRMARYVVEAGWDPDLILASTAQRVSETLQLVRAQLPKVPDMVVTRRLYLAPVSEIVSLIREHGGEHATLWVVGHNPGLQELVEHWLGPLPKFPTASVARFVFPISKWSSFSLDLKASERDFVKPRDLD